MTCQACRDHYRGKRPAHFASDPRCAFPDGGPFTPDNWNCMTAGLIRDLAEKERDGVKLDYAGDQSSAMIRLDNDYAAFEDMAEHALFVTWYKRRGATGGMWLIGDGDDGPPRPPTEAEALAIAGHWKAGTKVSSLRNIRQRHHSRPLRVFRAFDDPRELLPPRARVARACSKTRRTTT